MCHNAWQRHACVTHGMPCVNMHGSLPCLYKGFKWAVLTTKRAARRSPWEQQGEGGGREKRKGGKEKRKGGKERRKGGKGKKKRKEERGGREEKEGVLTDLDGKEPGTALQEVGFLLLWLFYA